ncbi:uncharacterized protein LOC125664554 [Ostrea edulis]|uniref:uncharacterized protein LOC125664554 n=1 Tax=Ostrea edulis TaxID=37623 RepID=UPI002096585B|nr:uncharacterized protein LOC125664554 [Ostrea edulis]
MNSFVFLCIAFVAGEKRLLLNDPSLLQTKLDALETKFMDLMTKYTSQESVINELKSKNNDQDRVINDLRGKLDNSVQGGATFVRWGKTSCPSNTTDQIYSGFIGGSNYHSSGGAAEYVCLTPDPDFTSISSRKFRRHVVGVNYIFCWPAECLVVVGT